MVIDETGGLHGVRDGHAVLLLEQLPGQKAFGKELYPGIHLKAAVYVRTLIYSHPFIDGNKRTAMSAASIFLENNGYSIVAREGAIERFALRACLKTPYSAAITAFRLRRPTARTQRSIPTTLRPPPERLARNAVIAL